jgi:hypothetical protein
MAVHPWLAFLRNYILRAGFKDGTVGFVVSLLNSYYVFLKLAKLWERQRQPSPGPPGTRWERAAGEATGRATGAPAGAERGTGPPRATAQGGPGDDVPRSS